MQYIVWACLLGALSAASLPLGSWIGLKFRFTSSQLSFLAAFGAGALLAALSVELIAPTTMALVAGESGHHGDPKSAFFAMVIGCVAGGLLYVLLDKLVNKKGGFLRKTSTLLHYYNKKKTKEQEHILDEISRHPLFQNFPPQHIETLMSELEPVEFEDGEIIIREGEPASNAYIITEGLIKASLKGDHLAELTTDYMIVNLIPILKGVLNLGTGIAKGKVKALRISKEGFNTLRDLSPDFDAACWKLAEERMGMIGNLISERNTKMINWAEDAKNSLVEDKEMPDVPDMQKMKEEHHGSPLAIWLGILLDGIPESMVIGAGMLIMLSAKLAVQPEISFLDVVPFTLIAGLFLSNFPEALSSSANMLKQGWSKKRIFLMWFSLMVITAIGAGIGYQAAGMIDHTWLVLLEGLAAGAMLTMIAAAMIPEAVVLGSGNLVGLSTLAGFLSAILFKLLE
ncbi:MAG: cyclic nucleotide-binding domain-containing protein [Cyclobacteriaceae bacterium]|nr:cyclic nucleotide-binding domain-containing protein [Cyclobacteriaceae bacterium]